METDLFRAGRTPKAIVAGLAQETLASLAHSDVRDRSRQSLVRGGSADTVAFGRSVREQLEYHGVNSSRPQKSNPNNTTQCKFPEGVKVLEPHTVVMGPLRPRSAPNWVPTSSRANPHEGDNMRHSRPR